LLISPVDPVEIIVFAMSFPEPHAICTIFMFIPCMFIMMPGVLVTAIVLSLSALVVPMVILGQSGAW